MPAGLAAKNRQNAGLFAPQMRSSLNNQIKLKKCLEKQLILV
jgi:hypothetical protein